MQSSGQNPGAIPAKRSSHGLSRREMRASLLLPIGIIVAIWLVGLVVAAVVPTAVNFTTIISLTIALSLIVFLLYWTRGTNGRLRLLALLFALPALIGLTSGVTSGNLRPIIIGVALTFFLLVAQRFFSTPLSFRAANRYFQQGDLDNALRLINKSIDARPTFWESHQLRALIRLAQLDFRRAEADAREAVAFSTNAHQPLNTLGQIYLAQEQYAAVQQAYEQALALEPDSAIYQFYLGLCHFRQHQYQPAAENLAAATQGTLPTSHYDLRAYFYLGRSLDKLGNKKTAQEAYAAMPNFKDGLTSLEEQLAHQPDYPHVARLRQDVDEMKKVIGNR